MGRIVIGAYRPKPGRAAELIRLTAGGHALMLAWMPGNVSRDAPAGCRR
ncbi:MAG: hypothetical protein OEU49_06330 [Chromatiales bacterium]|nr:hypothetical protein [Chromatiales bacterium]MDH4030445.1 hypothetical protein [Chromatiales bacterium]